jgi:hypothetical protein
LTIASSGTSGNSLLSSLVLLSSASTTIAYLIVH